MRLLHTGDWHIGKVLRGVPRLDEQRMVLAEIVAIVRDESVDVVLVAGDVFDGSAPSADAQRVAFDALLAIRDTGAHVLVVAGNHDSGEAFEAWRPVFAAAGIELRGRLHAPTDGGLVDVRIVRTDERLITVMMPFVSQRRIVKADDLFALADYQKQGAYRQRVRDILRKFADHFATDAVNVVLAHATVANARFGGGERMSQSVFDYLLDPADFPSNASYVALGHLHQAQTIPVGAPARYSGAPIAVDFGDQYASPSVVIIDAVPGLPAVARLLPLASPRKLRTITAPFSQLGSLIERGEVGPDDLLRVIVQGTAKATDLADRVRALLPNALEVRTDVTAEVSTRHDERRAAMSTLSPTELLRQYLGEIDAGGLVDERIVSLFDELLTDAEGTETEADDHGVPIAPAPKVDKAEKPARAPKTARAPKVSKAGTGATPEPDWAALLEASVAKAQADRKDPA